MEGSYGGRYGKDGLDAVDTLYANTRNNPIEDIESHYPLRVTRYELNEDTGGAWALARRARHDPRDRVQRAGRLLARGRRLEVPAPGLFGGGDGTPGAVVLNPGTDREQVLPSKFPYRKAAAGDRLLLVGPSGGGYGDPAERDPAAVREDVADGYAREE